MTERRRVYGIVPPTGKYIREDRCQTPIKNLKTVALRVPIDLLYATGAFEAAGCDCRVDDYPGEDIGWADLESRLREFKPHYLIMSITTPSLDEDMEAAALAKRVDPSIITIAKGAHFNTLDVSSLEKYPALDVVLRGEIEETCMALGRGEPLDSVAGISRRENGKIIRNPDRGFTQDLDAIPFPSRHLANNALYFRPDTGELQTTIITNRGCPFHCVYCLANQTAGVKNRYRSVENVIAEIKECVEKHNIRNFLFRSDLFTQNKRWVIRLCQAILDEGLDIEWACNSRVDTITAEALTWMKKAGCWIIAFGVESGDQEPCSTASTRAPPSRTPSRPFSSAAMPGSDPASTSSWACPGIPAKRSAISSASPSNSIRTSSKSSTPTPSPARRFTKPASRKA
jgi:anaerobic magnesium-protoporphyrin IX monomethyl ester cyclase